MEGLTPANAPAEGVTVTVDQTLTAVTDKDGRFRFAEVPEGRHRVNLAIHELPAEFDVGPITEDTVVVLPNRPARTDFGVVRLSVIQGHIDHPKGVPTDAIVIRLMPGNRYTTADEDGNFTFYNVRAGSYTAVVDEKTLPEISVLTQPVVSARETAQPIHFAFEIRKPEKPVRNVLERK